mmetsp:Transcript_8140/g.20006  ORF Transcript_8140/g.20006 Transcript_8140/m.20006 type:complete len:632 (+) Transcript_8140:388-2283(+)
MHRGCPDFSSTCPLPPGDAEVNTRDISVGPAIPTRQATSTRSRAHARTVLMPKKSAPTTRHTPRHTPPDTPLRRPSRTLTYVHGKKAAFLCPPSPPTRQHMKRRSTQHNTPTPKNPRQHMRSAWTVLSSPHTCVTERPRCVGACRHSFGSCPHHRRLLTALLLLLCELPQWRHFPEPSDLLHHHLDALVHLLVGREPTDAEPNRRVRQLLIHTDGSEHVRRFERCRGAGGSAAHGDAPEGHEERLALHIRKRQVHIAVVTMQLGAVESDVGQCLDDAVLHSLGEPLDVPSVVVHLLLGHLTGLAEAHYNGRWQGAAAHAPLLPAAVYYRHQTHTRLAAHVDRTDSLGSVDLVCGEGHQVDVHLVNVDRDLAVGLGCVSVEEDLLLAAEVADPLDGLHHADLIVDHHDAHQGGIVPDGALQLRQTYQTVLVDREVGDVPAFLLQRPTRRQYTLVLDLCGDDVFLLVAVVGGHAFDGQVVALGGPARKQNLLGLGAYQISHLLSGLLDEVLRLPAKHVAAAVGVPIHLGVEWHHGVHHPGVDGRGALVVHEGGALLGGQGGGALRGGRVDFKRGAAVTHHLAVDGRLAMQRTEGSCTDPSGGGSQESRQHGKRLRQLQRAARDGRRTGTQCHR